MAKTTLQDFFQVVILASGTPSPMQINVAKFYDEYTCGCSFGEAVANNYILKPKFNFIKTSYEKNFLAAIHAVLKNENKIAAEFAKNNNGFIIPPKIIINCQDIDEIASLIKEDYIKQNAGILFHIIAIHSDKPYISEDGSEKIVTASIDCKEEQKKIVMEKIQTELDNDTMFNDNLPIILCQVKMISEGINLKSFSSTIITTQDEQIAMQQIGRVVRKFTYPNGIKKTNSNIYVMSEQYDDIYELLFKLQKYDLTDKSFDWANICFGHGHKIETELNELISYEWEDMLNNNPEIIEKFYDGIKNKAEEHKNLEEKELKLAVENVENRFWELAAAGKLTEEEVTMFSRKYLVTEIHKTSKDICDKFAMELLNR